MGARSGTGRALTALLVCVIAVAGGACSGSDGEGGGDADLELEEKWYTMISNAIAARPEDCLAGVGGGCETHAAAVNAVTEQVLDDVNSRADKARYEKTIAIGEEIMSDYDGYFTDMCATVPETAIDSATSVKLTECSNAYGEIVSGAGELMMHLRPSPAS